MADWLDNIPVPTPATPGQNGQNRTTGDWLDNVQPPGNEPSIAARANVPPASATNMFGMGPHTDDTGQPEYLTPALSPEADANVRAGANLVGRTMLRANPVLAIPNALVVGGQLAGDALNRKLGVTPADAPVQPPFNPLERGIDALGLTMDPNAGKPMQIVDAVAPWLIPTGNQVGRVQEAPGAFNKLMTAGRSVMGNMVDWAASDEFQKEAQAEGWGPLAQMIAGAVGGNVRQGVARVGATQVPKVVPPKPDAGGTVDLNKQLIPPSQETPNVPVTSTVPPFRDVADPNNSVASWLSGASSLPFAGTGESSAVKAQTEAIARTANKGLQGLDPGVTPVGDAGPGSLRTAASNLAQEARDKIMGEERDLMSRSDAIEGQIGVATRVDATNLRNKALQIATDDTLAPAIRQAGENAFNEIEKAVDPVSGTVTFGALKGLRSTFGRAVDDLYQASSGERTGKNQVARAVSPIEDAMTATMQEAANQKGVGPAWAQLDADWATHSAVKRNLADTGGVLTADRTRFDPQPGAQGVANLLTNAVAGKGAQGTSPIMNIEEGLGERQARSAVAETVASMAQPKSAISRQDFRPDVFGQGEQARVDPAILNWVEQKAGPEARRNIETAGEAGARTSEPNRVGGWKKAFGSVLSAAPYVGATAAALGPAGAVAATPLTLLLTSMAHDPDFIRAVANRSKPFTDPALATQMLTHAALGSNPDAIDPVEAFRYGVGQAANAVGSGVSGAVNSIPAILKYLSVAPQPGSQR
jgi:hypothetical protein